MSGRGPTADGDVIVAKYLVCCPDVVDINVAGRPDLTFHCPLAADGRVNLGPLGRPRIEGKTIPQVAQVVADQAGIAPEMVEVKVAEFNSQEVYLFGQVTGEQHSVAYRGQETVLALLQRTGGITKGAAPDHVYVVRPHVADGQRPEIFHVDLQSIVIRHDDSTNVRLQPFDQIHVGETRQARVERCIPPWIRPAWRLICDTPNSPEKRQELATQRQERRQQRRAGMSQPVSPAPAAEPAPIPETLPAPRPLEP